MINIEDIRITNEDELNQLARFDYVVVGNTKARAQEIKYLLSERDKLEKECKIGYSEYCDERVKNDKLTAERDAALATIEKMKEEMSRENGAKLHIMYEILWPDSSPSEPEHKNGGRR